MFIHLTNISKVLSYFQDSRIQIQRKSISVPKEFVQREGRMHSFGTEEWILTHTRGKEFAKNIVLLWEDFSWILRKTFHVVQNPYTEYDAWFMND